MQNPCLIIEVLSPGTEGYDRGNKFRQYRRISSLKEYILVNSDSMGVECYRLNQQGKWELTPYFSDLATPNPDVEFLSVDFTCAIDLVYEDVEFFAVEPDSPP